MNISSSSSWQQHSIGLCLSCFGFNKWCQVYRIWIYPPNPGCRVYSPPGWQKKNIFRPPGILNDVAKMPRISTRGGPRSSCNQLDMACQRRPKDTKIKATKVRKKAPKKLCTISSDQNITTKKTRYTVRTGAPSTTKGGCWNLKNPKGMVNSQPEIRNHARHTFEGWVPSRSLTASLPLKSYLSNHPFSGAMLVSGMVGISEFGIYEFVVNKIYPKKKWFVWKKRTLPIRLPPKLFPRTTAPSTNTFRDVFVVPI